MRQILDEIMPPHKANARQPGPVILGIPTGEEGEELALVMLQQFACGGGCHLELLRPGTPMDEIIGRVGADQTAGVLVACLPPAGLSPARYLCKRLRAEFSRIEAPGRPVGPKGQPGPDARAPENRPARTISAQRSSNRACRCCRSWRKRPFQLDRNGIKSRPSRALNLVDSGYLPCYR